jgi:spore maturation protein CgeB
MPKAKRIFFVADTKDFTDKLLLAMLRKEIKGFIRLGHDVQVFSYNEAFRYVSPLTSPKWVVRQYKSRVDELLVKQIRNYEPDIIHVSFAKYLDAETIKMAREAAAGVPFIGIDVDLWPEMHEDRMEAAAKLDLVLTTYGENGQQSLKEAAVRCVFMPNVCDPDIEHRYDVSDEWRSDILFTGKLRHKNYPTEELRSELVSRLSKMKNCALYGCCDRPLIGGIQYFYAISGAKIGLSINAVNDVRLYHSDRLTQYLACGTFVLAKRVPDSGLLFKDKVHLRYFDAAEEFFDLANWYLAHEDERIKIANAGMEYVHAEFNCEKIAKYTLDLIEAGAYKAPWTV